MFVVCGGLWGWWCQIVLCQSSRGRAQAPARCKTAGFWCPEGSSSETVAMCIAGNYGTAGGAGSYTDDTCEGACTCGEDMYCPAGASKAGVAACNSQLVDAGWTNACALLADSSAECHGYNINGQLSGGPYLMVKTSSYGAVALSPDGTLSWVGGYCYYGECSVPSGSFTSVSMGSYHGCALGVDSTISCWGANWNGQSSNPGGSDFVAVSAGDSHSCGLHSDGSITCWGYGDQRVYPPTGVAFSAISSGVSGGCAIVAADGTVQCWGADYGYGQFYAPTTAGFVQISTGYLHTCGVLETGEAVCWGAQNLPDYYCYYYGMWEGSVVCLAHVVLYRYLQHRISARRQRLRQCDCWMGVQHFLGDVGRGDTFDWLQPVRTAQLAGEYSALSGHLRRWRSPSVVFQRQPWLRGVPRRGVLRGRHRAAYDGMQRGAGLLLPDVRWRVD